MEEVTVHSWCKHTYSLFLFPLRLWHIKYVRWQRECVDVLQWTHWASIITPINLEPDPQTHARALAFIVPLSFHVELRCLIQPQNIKKTLYNISLNIWGRSLWVLQYHLYPHSPFGSPNFTSQFWEGIHGAKATCVLLPYDSIHLKGDKRTSSGNAEKIYESLSDWHHG